MAVKVRRPNNPIAKVGSEVHCGRWNVRSASRSWDGFGRSCV